MPDKSEPKLSREELERRYYNQKVWPPLAPSTGSASVIVAEAYQRLRAAAEPRGGDHPPPAKKGWNHSERVLVYYPADPEMDRTDKWSIAYFHHKPPFEQKPHWVDFNTSRGAPDYWWPLPELPNHKLTDATKGDSNG